MAIQVDIPHSWINNDRKHGYNNELISLYDRLPKLIKEYPTDKDIKITYHTHSGPKNNWHIKKGYVPGYLYFDKLGFAAWSELSKKYEEPTITIKDVAEVSEICDYYTSNNVSKGKQPDIKDTKIPEKPYVIVMGQKPGDMVLDLAYINFPELYQMVKKVYEHQGYNVVFKPHPSDKNSYPGSVKGSIHELIRHCEAVFTVNSGTGFEAILHNKRVFISGDCEYKWVATTLKNKQDVKDSLAVMEKPVSTITNVCFLHHCFKEFFVNAYDDDSIRRKIERTIEEYET